jgi:hypothetical protein
MKNPRPASRAPLIGAAPAVWQRQFCGATGNDIPPTGDIA